MKVKKLISHHRLSETVSNIVVKNEIERNNSIKRLNNVKDERPKASLAFSIPKNGNA